MRSVWWLMAGVLLLVSPVWAITLAWDPSSGASGYRLYYGVASGVYDTVLDTGASTSASVGGLQVGELYFFAATAINDHGESGYSNEVRTVIQDATPPPDAFPTIALTTPTDGATVERRSRVILTAEALDDIAVERVDFYVNGTWIGNDRAPPYTATWQVPNQRRRTFRVWADAIDSAAHLTSSEVVTVQTR
jgi:hypothetical protein